MVEIWTFTEITASDTVRILKIGVTAMAQEQGTLSPSDWKRMREGMIELSQRMTRATADPVQSQNGNGNSRASVEPKKE
jgi:hypothetical protein